MAFLFYDYDYVKHRQFVSLIYWTGASRSHIVT